ncbi:MAG: long-chain fatty acid--CoA ligase [Candidatus Eremiobacteraeota bacterium]|nr:long-chain fatty acid--CoA ligase [Candidatus Eremiobacteraeota bacterium]
MNSLVNLPVIQTEIPRTTLPALIRSALAQYRTDVLCERVDGTWISISSGTVLERVDNLACALRDMGIDAGDRVALISPNRIDWIIADLAVMVAGCVVVPIFPTQALDQVQYILEDSGSKVVFVDSQVTADRLRSLWVPLPQVVRFDGGGDTSLAALEMRGAAIRASDPAKPGIYEEFLGPDDLAVLMYTSGTTGQPKGVMLSHNNLAFVVQSSFAYAFKEVHAGECTLSVLPFSHIYEHMIIYGYLTAGVRYYICSSVEALRDDLRDVRPVVVTCVPRIFERILGAIIGTARAHGGVRAKVVPWALEVGRKYKARKIQSEAVSPLLRIQYFIARSLVLRKLKPLLGLDRLKYFVSGSASLHIDTALTLLGADIPVIEGYGPTECAPTISVNRLEDNRYGTVGKPIPGVDVKIEAEGEIVVRGPGVMKGYYKNAAATAQVLHHGWYSTGDIGALDSDGYLRITDRKNELFKTSGGKFIAPARVESAIKRSPYVNQVLLVGSSRPHPAALVSPNWDALRHELRIKDQIANTELSKRDDVNSFIRQEVIQNTADLASFEQVRFVSILPRDLTVDQGELSPTLKIKRRLVEQRFADLIESAYGKEKLSR